MAKFPDHKNQSDEDELSSSEEVVNKQFDKIEFLKEFQNVMKTG